MSSSPYREWRPPLELAGEVACLWSGSVGVVGIDHADRVLPDACVDVIWDGTRLFVAGPDTGPVPIAPAPPRTYVGVRLRPGHAGRVLGRPACEIRDRRLNLAELWDRPATASRADTLVDGLVAALEGATECAGPGLVARLAADLGASERSLHRRCVAAVGYGPKTLDRVLRFCRARRLARVLPATSLAALAAAAGYADQAHLTRDWRRLDGRTPSESFKIARRRAAKLSP
jgi:AraC-like DNA-binding protein